MKPFLTALVSVGLGVASFIGVPFCLVVAYLGFSGQLADAGQALNTQAGAVWLGIAVAIVLAAVAWFRHAASRM
jgi:hypothetical protein